MQARLSLTLAVATAIFIVVIGASPVTPLRRGHRTRPTGNGASLALLAS